MQRNKPGNPSTNPSFLKGAGSNLRLLGLLIGITILAVTGFQLYWLRQNYFREKKSLSIKTEMAFRESMLQLQVSKLKLDGAFSSPGDSTPRKFQMIMNDDDGDEVKVKMFSKPEVITTMDVFRAKLRDSVKIISKTQEKPGVIISLNKSSINVGNDSLRIHKSVTKRNGHVFNLLYGVDSLQDSIRLTEIDSAYSITLKKEKLNIPYKVIRADSASDDDDRVRFNEVTVGLAHPVTYKLQLGNTFPYLLKQILQPILFSFLLLGITILSFVLLYRNILKQRKLAELKNEFISNITHELKTPIATVGVAIEALKSFNAIDNPERTREYLSISQNELQRLSLLVDKVLKLSMFEKKEVELKYEAINIKDIVDEVVTSLKLQLEKTNSRLTVTEEGDLFLQGDRLHLLSVVFNLIDNAIKYSKADPAIQISLQGTDNNVVMTVTDNGIGIPTEYKERIFEKFFRVPHGDTHNAKGYGLGLSYVSQVINKHDGSITVESQPGIGSKFIITLPKNPGKPV